MDNVNIKDWKGSIQVRHTFLQSMLSHKRINLTEANTKAQNFLQRPADIISSMLIIERGFLVYKIILVDSEYNFYRIIIDAGNGEILNQTVNWEGDGDRGFGGGSFGGGGASGSW